MNPLMQSSAPGYNYGGVSAPSFQYFSPFQQQFSLGNQGRQQIQSNGGQYPYFWPSSTNNSYRTSYPQVPQSGLEYQSVAPQGPVIPGPQANGRLTTTGFYDQSTPGPATATKFAHQRSMELPGYPTANMYQSLAGYGSQRLNYVNEMSSSLPKINPLSLNSNPLKRSQTLQPPMIGSGEEAVLSDRSKYKVAYENPDVLPRESDRSLQSPSLQSTNPLPAAKMIGIEVSTLLSDSTLPVFPSSLTDLVTPNHPDPKSKSQASLNNFQKKGKITSMLTEPSFTTTTSVKNGRKSPNLKSGPFRHLNKEKKKPQKQREDVSLQKSPPKSLRKNSSNPSLKTASPQQEGQTNILENNDSTKINKLLLDAPNVENDPSSADQNPKFVRQPVHMNPQSDRLPQQTVALPNVSTKITPNLNNLLGPSFPNDIQFPQANHTLPMEEHRRPMRNILSQSYAASDNRGNLRLVDFEDAQFSSHPNGIVKAFAGNTYKGLYRNYNEDRVIMAINPTRPSSKAHLDYWPRISVFGIFDGHNGHGCTEFMKNNIIDFILNDPNFPMDCNKALVNAFLEADKAFFAQAYPEGKHQDRSGTCGLIILVVDNQCITAHVGDSRAVLSSKRGKTTKCLTKDHKPLDPPEYARITSAGGHVAQLSLGMKVGPHRVFPGSLTISRAFGDMEAKDVRIGGNPNVVLAYPDVSQFPLTEDHDFIFLGCKHELSCQNEP